MASAVTQLLIWLADSLKGTPDFLPAVKLVTVHDSLSKSKDISILWDICACMGRGGSSNDANKAIRGKHVSWAMFSNEP